MSQLWEKWIRFATHCIHTAGVLPGLKKKGEVQFKTQELAEVTEVCSRSATQAVEGGVLSLGPDWDVVRPYLKIPNKIKERKMIESEIIF